VNVIAFAGRWGTQGMNPLGAACGMVMVAVPVLVTWLDA